MPNSAPHGNAPDHSRVALLLIDIVNDLEFQGGEQLLQHALLVAARIRQLCLRARTAQIPVVYVNDNFGRWRSDFQAQVTHCLDDHIRGEPIVHQLQPMKEDYFVLKPKHSGFYGTALDLLLKAFGVETLILTGIATNICVLFTASDAYLRDFKVVVPQDCCAANCQEDHSAALRQMQQVLKADTRPSVELSFSNLLSECRSESAPL